MFFFIVIATATGVFSLGSIEENKKEYLPPPLGLEKYPIFYFFDASIFLVFFRKLVSFWRTGKSLLTSMFPFTNSCRYVPMCLSKVKSIFFLLLKVVEWNWSQDPMSEQSEVDWQQILLMITWVISISTYIFVGNLLLGTFLGNSLLYILSSYREAYCCWLLLWLEL